MIKLLITTDIRSGYSGSEVLHGINMKAADKKITLITGPNGAGKSTLLRTIVGLNSVNGGKTQFKDKDITRMKTADIIKLGISYVPQGAGIFPRMTVKDNLRMGGYLIRDKHVVEQRIDRVLELFPILRERLTQKAGFMSGGEVHILATARSLISSPELLLTDEPSTGLDVGKQELIFAKLKELNKNGLGILLVEQNVRESAKIADYMYFMTNGTVKFEGEPKDLIEQKTISDMLFNKL